jgi:hypothetical protein
MVSRAPPPIKPGPVLGPGRLTHAHDETPPTPNLNRRGSRVRRRRCWHIIIGLVVRTADVIALSQTNRCGRPAREYLKLNLLIHYNDR